MDLVDDNPTPRVTVNLKLTNRNDFTIEDRFDGVPYTFEPGVTVAIPSDAARHMLGWYPGVDMKAVATHVQKRWGWNTPEHAKSGDAARFFANLTFKSVAYKLVEVSEEMTDDDVLPSPLKRAPGRPSKEAPAAQP